MYFKRWPRQEEFLKKTRYLHFKNVGKEKQASPRRSLLSSGEGAEKQLPFKMPLFSSALRGREIVPRIFRSPGGECSVLQSGARCGGGDGESFSLFVPLFLLKVDTVEPHLPPDGS